MLKRKITFLSLLLFCCPVFAEPILANEADLYYSPSLSAQPSEPFKQLLHQVLQSFHISEPGRHDKIVASCAPKSDNHCYHHIQLSYKKARQYLFGYLYLKNGERYGYAVESAYCDDEIDNDLLPSSKPLGPMLIPDAKVINTEHAWPQSRFNQNFSKALQKSDLHALYPVRMKVNSTRGNHPFGEVVDLRHAPCSSAALGWDIHNQLVFEPVDKIKGNVARSLFYFSIRYKLPLDTSQEWILRKWHRQDPVDSQERDKNEEIYKIQHVRNPFVDHPEWVAKIKNF